MAVYPVTMEQMVSDILAYFDSSSDIWQRVNNGLANEAEIIRAYSYVPQIQVQMSTNGQRVLGIDYADDVLSKMTVVDDDILNSFNSNASSSGFNASQRYKMNIPSDWSTDGNSYSASSGTSIPEGGGMARLATIADKANLAVAGVSIGAALGVKIDQLLYSIDPNWWDTHYPNINPDRWNYLVQGDPVGGFFFRTLLGLPSEEPTMYISEDALAYTYMLLRDSGAFGEGGKEASIEAEWADTDIRTLPFGSSAQYQTSSGSAPRLITTDAKLIVKETTGGGRTTYSIQMFNDTPFSYTNKNLTTGAETTTQVTTQIGTTIFNNTPYYTATVSFNIWDGSGGSYTGVPTFTGEITQRETATILLDGTITENSPLPGTSKMSDTEAPNGIPDPDVITGTTVDEVIEQLKREYPHIFDGSITSNVLQNDGTISSDNYVPIPVPDITSLTDQQPITGDRTQTDTKLKDQTFINITTKTPTDTPPDTGEGNASPFVMPTGNASSLWAVYHPSQSQLNAFGAWLWSSDFVEQLKRLFNDPMQAIIGVHKVFAPIPTGGSQTIKCGYLDSGVSSPTVSSQYTEVDCGTVNCREYFGNVFDYDPHTKVSIYLPFIGVVPLKVSEVMRASITVTYGVDVITGACLAKVKVTRDGGGAILYSYGGSCACHYPISSGSYAGIISGIVTSAIGIAGGIATDNPLAAIGGAMAGLHQAHTDVQRSGGFTGCAGAMGPKIPYLIIDRPQTRLAADFEAYQGKPANSTQFIGDCSGFVRATEVHFSAPGVFDEETREVESLLKAGVKLD